MSDENGKPWTADDVRSAMARGRAAHYDAIESLATAARLITAARDSLDMVGERQISDRLMSAAHMCLTNAAAIGAKARALGDLDKNEL